MQNAEWPSDAARSQLNATLKPGHRAELIVGRVDRLQAHGGQCSRPLPGAAALAVILLEPEGRKLTSFTGSQNIMKAMVHKAGFAGLGLVCLALTGCSTANVNPAAPRAHTGYVDFYTDTDMGLSWEVKRADDGAGEMRVVFSEFQPVRGTILRLAAPPGSHRFQVWFTNQVTEGPQTVQVQVLEGKVTPVRVTLTPVGSTSVQRKDYSFRGSAKGYGSGTKVVSGQSAVFAIGAVAGSPQAYGPKERMPYWSLEAK